MELFVNVWEGIREFSFEVPNESMGSFFKPMRVNAYFCISYARHFGLLIHLTAQMFGSLHKTSSLFSSAKLSARETLILVCLFQLWDVKKALHLRPF